MAVIPIGLGVVAFIGHRENETAVRGLIRQAGWRSAITGVGATVLAATIAWTRPGPRAHAGATVLLATALLFKEQSLALPLLLIGPTPSGAAKPDASAESDIAIEFERYTLDNGLEVVLETVFEVAHATILSAYSRVLVHGRESCTRLPATW